MGNKIKDAMKRPQKPDREPPEAKQYLKWDELEKGKVYYDLNNFGFIKILDKKILNGYKVLDIDLIDEVTWTTYPFEELKLIKKGEIQ